MDDFGPSGTLQESLFGRILKRFWIVFSKISIVFSSCFRAFVRSEAPSLSEARARASRVRDFSYISALPVHMSRKVSILHSFSLSFALGGALRRSRRL